MAAVLPRPSDQQIENFVDLVCHAHSWYKHLPLLPPGVPFRFFIDPNSGCDLIAHADGRVMYEERTEQSQRFHYTWTTTREYRRGFGHLAYGADAGTNFVVQAADKARAYDDCPIFASDESWYRIPVEVAETGSVSLTAIVHPLTARVWVWQRFLRRREPRKWPSETGGDKTLEAIQAACERASRESVRLDQISDELVRLLEPEKQRLQEEMRGAIRRMVHLVYG